MERHLVSLRKGYRFFDKNKMWLIGVFYFFSMLRDYIWYSYFGVNILNYSSVSETILSLFNFSVFYISIYLLYIVIMGFIPYRRLERVSDKILISGFKFFLLLSAILVYYFLFKQFVSVLSNIVLIASFIFLIQKKDLKGVLSLALIGIVALIFLDSLMQYQMVISTNRRNHTQFKFSTTNTELISFEYEGKTIDSSLERYYLVGEKIDYFFIYDSEIKRTLIIPKSQCKNISAKNFIFWRLAD